MVYDWRMSLFLHKSHNVSVLLYHLVCPAKYRRAVIDEAVDRVIVDACREIEKRFEMHFLEIGTDRDHVHFLIQSVPTYAPTRIARVVKSITARQVFAMCPQVRKKLWGGEFWTDGFFISSVGRSASEGAVRDYVKRQGGQQEYVRLHEGQLLLV